MKSLVENLESNKLELLEGKLSNKVIADKLNEVIEYINKLEPAVKRDRGPKSEHVMTEDDARRVIMGDLKDVSHKAAAEELGLSYGQVYSARGGYTFKKIHKEKAESQES